jgi:2-polyprenyl-3-methyl-5-hydroxy-6-metoxy-1,4-benzoquinol methylase
MLELNWRATHKESFAELIQRGVYSVDFEHSAQARRFVAECIQRIAATIQTSRNEIAILDCGCGIGAWLACVEDTDRLSGSTSLQCYGFDLTPEMVEVARERLTGRVPRHNIREGDILDDTAYEFEGGPRLFDIVYAYDVIQQLPRADQLRGCMTMVKHVAPGGVALIFDHERNSVYGAIMATKKLATKYLSIPLVPAFYLNARYPPLASFARQIRSTTRCSTEILPALDRKKRAFVIGAYDERALVIRTLGSQ